jgi:prevent-host-death family protein
MKTISQRELRNDSGAVLRAVEAGETYRVTRNGTPVAELRPLDTHSRFASREVLLAHLEQLRTTFTRTTDSLEALRTEADEWVDPYE